MRDYTSSNAPRHEWNGLKLSRRSSNALAYHLLASKDNWTPQEIADVVKPSELLKARHVGYKTVTELTEALREAGVKVPWVWPPEPRGAPRICLNFSEASDVKTALLLLCKLRRSFGNDPVIQRLMRRFDHLP